MSDNVVPFPTKDVRQVHQCAKCDCQTWYLDRAGFVVCSECGNVADDIAFAAISTEEKAAKIQQLEDLLGDITFAEGLNKMGWVKQTP